MKFDIVVIGASTSGLYAAELLAKSGRKVGVFERQAALSPANRTYIITPRLREFVGDVGADLVQWRVQTLSLVSLHASVDIVLREADWIVERTRLSDHLLARARAAGAEFFLGHGFLRFEMFPGRTELVFQDDEQDEVRVAAEAVIGADGLDSQAARAAGMERPSSAPIVQAEIDLPPGWDPAVTKVWFDVKDTCFFYWLIPASEKRGVLGLVGQRGRDMRPLLDRFLARHGLRANRYQGARVALYRPQLKPWGRAGAAPLYLVGDSAGQVKVTTVGGTVSGLWGARAAATAIIEDTSYAHELRPLERELDTHWLIRKFLDRLDDRGYDRLIHCVTPAVRDFLARQNRDQMAGGVWNLLLREPRLAWCAISNPGKQ